MHAWFYKWLYNFVVEAKQGWLLLLHVAQGPVPCVGCIDSVGIR